MFHRLFLGLFTAVSLISTVAFADPIKSLNRIHCPSGQILKSDGQEWSCAIDETGGGHAFVLQDSSVEPQEVGEVLSISDRFVQTIIDVEPVGGGSPIDASFVAGMNGIFGLRSIVVSFFDANCQGTAYSQINLPGFLPALRGSFQIQDWSPVDPEPPSHFLVPIGDESTEVTTASRFHDGNGCENTVFTAMGWELAFVEDPNDLFTLPIQLVRQ